jgi:16S rRNA (uracil1498-N3)-methyltransferase
VTRRRWLPDRIDGDHALLLGDHAAHLSRVLRADVGDEHEVATPQGVRVGRVVSVTEGCVDFLLGEVQPDALTASVEIAIALAIFKFDRMEWAIEKCTELGVTAILPLIATRTEKHLAQAAAKRVERWRRLGAQASEQSRRASPPLIADPVKFDEILGRAAPSRVVLSETETVLSVASSLANAQRPILLGVGPEGGWTPGELHKFTDAGWKSATLGATILRAETAAIAAVAIALAYS